MYIELAGGTSLFQRVFPVPAVGDWVTLMASVDSFAAGAGMSASEMGAMLSWGTLRVGSSYTVQEGASLSGPWKDVSTSVATSTLHEFVVPPQPDKAQSFFRLRGP